MPPDDVLDQIQADQSRELNANVALARNQASWANTFQSTPPSEVLRANRDYGDLVNTAIERRMALAASTSEEGQRMYYNRAKFQEWQDQAPDRQDLLDSRIAHEKASTLAAGATAKFDQQKDAEAMQDVAGFATDLSGLKAIPGTPEYRTAVLAIAAQHPRAAATAWGTDTLKKISDEHDTAATILGNGPPGMDPASVETDDTGKSRVIWKPKVPEFETPEQARQQFGPTATIHQTASGKWTGTIKPDVDPDKVPDSILKSYADAQANFLQNDGMATDPTIADATTKATAKHAAAAAKTLVDFYEAHYPGLKAQDPASSGTAPNIPAGNQMTDAEKAESIANAQAAIARNPDSKAAVLAKLKAAGIDTSKLDPP